MSECKSAVEFSEKTNSAARQNMSISIKWKGQTSNLDFKTQSLEFGDEEWQNHVSLGEVLERISAASRVPIENIKLLHSGGKFG